MRKWRSVLLCVLLVLVALTPAALADIKPTDVPHMVTPGEAGFASTFGGAAFADLWVELEGIGAELPQTTHVKTIFPWPPFILDHSLDDYLRGPVPIGFNFKYMNGPVEPAPGWPPEDWPLKEEGKYAPPAPEDWPAELSDLGYDEVFVSTNGFIIFSDPSFAWPSAPPVSVLNGAPQQPGLGSWNWWPWQLPIAEPPNNFVAPYWTDLAISDNSYHKVTKVCLSCGTGSTGATERLSLQADSNFVGGEYVPCEWELVERPRGRLLYATLGEAPNRRFVVEWLNARNHWTGFLATFQLQLFEGSNAILFLYKDFQTKEGEPYFDVPSVVIGMEDSFGTTGVGQVFTLDNNVPMFPGTSHRWLSTEPEPHWFWKWLEDLSGWALGTGARLPAAKESGDMVGFVY